MSVKNRLQTPRSRYVLASLAFLAGAAIVLTWFLEYRYYINDFFRAWNFAIGSPVVFLYNALLMFLCAVALWAVCRQPMTVAGILWSFITILTYVHINKFRSRGFPLQPEDFQLASEAASLSKFVDLWGIARLVLAIALMWVLVIAFNKFVAPKWHLKAPKTTHKSWLRRYAVAARFVAVMATCALLVGLTDFARHNDGARYTDTFLGTHFTAWNQNRNYDDNGFILGFLYNLQKLQMAAPEGYNEEEMTTAYDKYSAAAETQNQTRKKAADEDVSVVVILNESFLDPSAEFNGHKLDDLYPHDGGDIMPNLHKIQQQYPHGTMYSLDYGGGTANIEFEVLTGLSNYWINTVPYTALVPRANAIPSIAADFKTAGYQTTAIHPYNSGMYKRNIALKKEGFDTFISDSEMKHTTHNGASEYINDQSAYRETLDVLRQNDDAQMIGLITMQNHTPYRSETYEELNFPLTTDAERGEEIAVYYQSLHTSDQYLGEFIDELDQLDKKVVVLFFGDHSAGLYKEAVENSDKHIRDITRTTPYFVYANYDAAFRRQQLPTTTPNCLVNTMYNTLGWQKAPLYYLLDDVCATEPILTAAYLEDRGVAEAAAIKTYKYLSYDILSGEQYWLNF